MPDGLFEEGIRLFNEEEFFDAHEVWEDMWQGYRADDRTFLQALIQIAAGFYHAQCKNPVGARSQLEKGIRKLAVYDPVHRTIRSEMLRASVEEWLALYRKTPEVAGSGHFPRIVRTHTSLSS